MVRIWEIPGLATTQRYYVAQFSCANKCDISADSDSNLLSHNKEHRILRLSNSASTQILLHYFMWLIIFYQPIGFYFHVIYRLQHVKILHVQWWAWWSSHGQIHLTRSTNLRAQVGFGWPIRIDIWVRFEPVIIDRDNLHLISLVSSLDDQFYRGQSC